ncbi:MAG: Ig-like domain-containing protein [Bacilli bacterium]|nr:Ig-like domain-containing protein [Bacilli bacterium]
MRKKKFLIGIIPVFMVGILLCNKPIKRIIEVKSNTYGTPANSAFTDENFYKCVIDNYYPGGHSNYDINLTDEQLESIKNLRCPTTYEVADIKGIEKLTNLENIDLDYYSDSLDFSNNHNLKSLTIYSKSLKSLNISNNTLLTNLKIQGAKLSELDLSNNINLEIFELAWWGASVPENYALVENIDLNNNVNLKELYLPYQNLTNINLDNFDKLEILDLSHNNIENINLTNNTLLKSLNLNSNKITNINLSNNILLKDINIRYNKIASIDLSKVQDIETLDLWGNKLEYIDLKRNNDLKILRLGNNHLTSLDVTNNTLLEELELGYLFDLGNDIESIDLSNNVNLKELVIANNKLTNIDLSKNVLLEKLILGNNQLKNIDLNKNIKLNYLDLSSNKLSSIDLSHNTALTYLNLSYNRRIKNLDLSNNTLLDTFYMYHLSLRGLDLSNNNNLRFIYGVDGLDSGISGEPIYINKYECSTESITDPVLLRLLEETGYENNLCSIYSTLINDYPNLLYQSIELSTDKDYKYIKTNGEVVNIEYTYHFLPQYIKSDYFIINDEKNYIITYEPVDDNILLFNVVYQNVSFSINNNKMIVEYNDDFQKEYDIINTSSITSDKYDLTKGYLFGEYDDIRSNINFVGGDINLDVSTNKIELKYDGNLLSKYDYVNCLSNKYNLSSNFINVIDNDISSFLANFDCINCKVYVGNNDKNYVKGTFDDKENPTLNIMYDNKVIKQYDLRFPASSVSLNTNSLKLNLDTKKTYNLIANITPTNAENKNVTWESSNTSVATVDENGLVTAIGLGEATITVKTEDGNFTDTCNVTVSEITTYTVTFKDGDNSYTSEFEENEDIVFKTDLEKTGYRLVGWKCNNQEYKLTDKLSMPSENIELTAIWEFVIPEIKNYESDNNNITGISLKTNVDNLNLGIDSIYQVKVSKHDGTDKTSGLVGTGDKVKIYLDNELVSEYDVIIKGDVTGTGTSTVSDVAKLYQYMKGKVTMDECYIKAGNVVDSDSTIKVNDVAKLYQFIKGKISSL